MLLMKISNNMENAYIASEKNVLYKLEWSHYKIKYVLEKVSKGNKG